MDGKEIWNKAMKKNRMITINLQEETILDLDIIAKTFGNTRSEIIRLFLTEGIKTFYTWHKKGGEENAMHETNDQS